MSTATRQQLEQWDRQLVWHAFTQMAEYEPWIVERGSGCYLIDVDGNRYLDGVSSLWCNVHGHRHPKLDAAVRGQLDRIAHCTSLGASNPTTIELAHRLVGIAPEGLNHVFFSDDGATAVEVALKIAFQYWRQCPKPKPEKTRYLAFEAAYHGDTLGAVSVGGVGRFRAMFEPLLFDIFQLPVPDPTRLPAGVASADACQYYLAQVAKVLEAHHEQIAAVVIEPLVQAAAGMIVHPPGFLRGVRELTQRYGVLLIADEVAVGMGRTGTLFASAKEDVRPDLVCLAKGLTGGYLPLAATLATTEIFAAFLGRVVDQNALFHGHTYGGNPLGAAAALATLAVFEEEDTLAKLVPKIARLSEHLDHLADHPHVRSARQCGLIAGIELVRDRPSDTPYPWQEQRGLAVCRHALAAGVWLRPLRDVVVVMPPLAIEIEQLDQIMHAVRLGIDAATDERP